MVAALLLIFNISMEKWMNIKVMNNKGKINRYLKMRVLNIKNWILKKKT